MKRAELVSKAEQAERIASAMTVASEKEALLNIALHWRRQAVEAEARAQRRKDVQVQ